MRHFGTLDRDGTGDYDGDGISDLDEFLRGSDPTDGEGRMTLVQGFNPLSYPVTDPETQPTTCRAWLEVLGEAQVESIARFDAAAGRFVACDWNNDTDFDLSGSEAYVVQMRMDTQMPMPGDAGCEPVELSAGLNLMSHPAPPLGLRCRALLTALENDGVTLIRRYNPVRGAFESCTLYDGDGSGAQPAGADFLIRRGEGYEVFATQSATVVLPGCGN